MAGPTSDVSQSNFPAKVVEVTSLTLIVVNAVLIAIDSSTPDSSVFDRCYFFFELLSVAFFSLEYALRLWTAVEEAEYAAPLHGRVRWALSPLNLLDLMALLPYVVDLALPDNPGGNKFRGGTAIGLVRLLRLFVLLRLERKFTAFARIHAVLRHKGEELLVTAFIALIMLVTSSSMVYYIENPSNDTFSDIPTAMWWAVTALTTVGYGDICPMTPMGRFFGAITAFVGVGFFAMPAGIISSGFVEAMMDEKRSKVMKDVKDIVDEELMALRTASPCPENALFNVSLGSSNAAALHAACEAPPGEEVLVLQHAAAAIRRQEHSLALSLLEERMRALGALDTGSSR